MMNENSDLVVDTLHNESSQSLLEHLNDLRKHLTWAAAGILIATMVSFIFAENILNFLLIPYANSSPAGAELQTLRPTESIETFFKVSLMAGVIVSMPFTLYQLWSFISPGLTPKERRYVYIFIPSALLLFSLGLLFAWFVLAPAAIFFLANFMPEIFRTEWTGQDYISFILSILFWLGLAFQLPIIVYFLARVGIVTSEIMRSQWRVAIVVIAVLAAVITPSIDPVTMLLTMAPLFVLYLMSIGLASIGYKQFARSVQIEEEE